MKIVSLAEVADWGSGGTPKRSVGEYFGEGVPWLSIADLNDGPVSVAKESLTAAGLANSSAKVVPPGTILVAMYGSIGKLGVAEIELCTSQAIAFAKPRANLVHHRYLFHYLLEQRPVLQALGRGGTQMNISQGELRKYPIPLPPMDEQRRIAAILDHADALRTKRRQVLAHLDALTQSIFHDMFGDPDSAGVTVAFGKVARLSGGRSLVADDSLTVTDFRVLKISAVTSGEFKPWESKPLPQGYQPPQAHLVRLGDLLMSRANTAELVGAVAYVDETPTNLALPDKIWRFDWLDHASVPVFYHALLHTKSIRRRISRLASGTGGSMKNVAQSKLAAMPLPLVSPDDQVRFAAMAAAVAKERATVLRALLADNELFASLQSRAFKGEL